MGYMNNDGLLYFWGRLKSIFVRTVNGTAPDANGNVAVAVPTGSNTSPKMDGTATVGTETAFARGDHIHPKDTSKANLASPTFTGTPKAPTASAGTNTTQIATTAFVQTAVGGKQDTLTFDTMPTSGSTNPVTSGGIASYVDDAVEGAISQAVGEIPNASTTTPKMDGTASTGTESAWSRGDHRHPTDTTRAPLNSPVFTGTPEAPTPSNNAYQKEIVTAAWVRTFFAQIGVGATSFKGVINSFSDITSTLHYIEKGWYWVVGTAGTYAGQDCEQGDFIYAIDSYLYGTKTISGTSYPYGDANMDGSVTNTDVVLIGRFLDGLETLSDDQKALADADGDGIVTANDRELIHQSLVDLNIHHAASVPNSAFAIVQTNIIPMTNSEIDTIVAS